MFMIAHFDPITQTSTGTPCSRCTLRNRECIYPKKEKFIAVPESYLREIEGEASLNRQSSASAAEFSSSADTQSSFFTSDRHETTDYSPVSDNRAARSHLREDCSAERFIQKLKDLSSSLHPFVQSDMCQPLGTGNESGYTYLRLKSDFHREWDETSSLLLAGYLAHLCASQNPRFQSNYHPNPMLYASSTFSRISSATITGFSAETFESGCL